jgi:hypothetical protein
MSAAAQPAPMWPRRVYACIAPGCGYVEAPRGSTVSVPGCPAHDRPMVIAFVDLVVARPTGGKT